MELLRVCDITGKNAVAKEIESIEDSPIENGAKAGRHSKPEVFLKGICRHHIQHQCSHNKTQIFIEWTKSLSKVISTKYLLLLENTFLMKKISLKTINLSALIVVIGSIIPRIGVSLSSNALHVNS